MGYILIEDPGLVYYQRRLKEEERTFTLALLARQWEKTEVFSGEGRKLRVEATGDLPRRNVWTRLLAYTVYNPLRQVRLRYEEVGDYALPELKERIKQCVAQDDDVLTQFMEREEILDELDAAASFEAVAKLVRKVWRDAG